MHTSSKDVKEGASSRFKQTAANKIGEQTGRGGPRDAPRRGVRGGPRDALRRGVRARGCAQHTVAVNGLGGVSTQINLGVAACKQVGRASSSYADKQQARESRSKQHIQTKSSDPRTGNRLLVVVLVMPLVVVVMLVVVAMLVAAPSALLLLAVGRSTYRWAGTLARKQASSRQARDHATGRDRLELLPR